MLSDKEEVLPACAVGVKPGHQDQVVYHHRKERHRIPLMDVSRTWSWPAAGHLPFPSPPPLLFTSSFTLEIDPNCTICQIYLAQSARAWLAAIH